MNSTLSPHVPGVGARAYTYQIIPASVKQPEERMRMNRLNRMQMKTIRQIEEVLTNFLALPKLTGAS